MRKAVCRFILRSIGWRIEADVPDLDKCVICVAPHTSNWDFILGKIAYVSIGRHAGFLIKKDWFFFPLNLILKSMGGVPVDRKKKRALVDLLVDEFTNRKHFCIAITPEGTRKRSPHWKMGFYHIAQKAHVPIVLTYIDYQDRVIGLKEVFHPTGDEQKDLAHIKNFFRNRHARFPDQFTTE